MFKFRGQAKFEGKYVIGFLSGDRITDNMYIEIPGEFVEQIHPRTLSISTGKLDSTGTEIFASFPIGGVMTEGGDVVTDTAIIWEVAYDLKSASFKLHIYRDNKLWSDRWTGDSKYLTIIGKQGGGNE